MLELVALASPPIAAEEVIAGEVTLNEAIRAAAIFVAAVVLSVVLRRVLVRALDRQDAERHVGRLTGRFLALLIIAVGVVYALGALGVRIGPLVGALGIGGVALAFAAQETLQNLIAGIMLQVRKPLRIGDQVKTGDYEGVVEDINLRTVELTTYDGLTVYVPNAAVLRAPIVNYTRTPLNRTCLAVGLAYGTDLQRAREVLLGACRSAEGVVEQRPTEVWVEEFGESSINFAVRYWHAADIASRWRVRSAVALSIDAALAEAGMTIPFPQRTLWFGPGNTSLTVTEGSSNAAQRSGSASPPSPREP